MAEALLRHLGGDRYEVSSAGTHPRSVVHPGALHILEERHVPTAGLVPKDVSTVIGETFDTVITVCDRAREQCPIFPGAETVHWAFPDPAEVEPAAQARVFNDVFSGLSHRIRLLLTVDERSSSKSPPSRP